MNTDETSSMHEEALLSEDADVLSAGTSSTNDPLLAVLQSLNKNMAAMGESLRSLKQNGEAQTSPTAKLPKNGNSHRSGMTLTQRYQMQTNSWPQTNGLKLSPVRTVQATKAILYWAKSHSLLPTQRKLLR